MAWFDRSAGEKRGVPQIPPEPVQQPATVELSAEAPGEELVAYLYKGSRVNGQMTFHGPAKIEGKVEGEVLCHATLTIGEGAEVKAKVSGEVVIIRGKVEGDVAARQRVELQAPARLTGNVMTPRLVITEGVVFDGNCSMGKSKDKVEGANPLRSSSEKVLEGEAPKRHTDSEN